MCAAVLILFSLKPMTKLLQASEVKHTPRFINYSDIIQSYIRGFSSLVFILIVRKGKSQI